MNKKIQLVLFIQIQVIFVLSIFMFTETKRLDQKLFNTNKLIYETLETNRMDAISEIKDYDIVIGSKNAPITMFLYSNVQCSACNSFVKDTYSKLKAEFIENGKLKLVIRYLAHKSKPNILFATKASYYSYQNNFYEVFVNDLANLSPSLDTAAITKMLLKSDSTSSQLDSFINDENIEQELLGQSYEFRNAGIRYTPTFIIGNQRLVGNVRYERLREFIFSQTN